LSITTKCETKFTRFFFCKLLFTFTLKMLLLIKGLVIVVKKCVKKVFIKRGYDYFHGFFMLKENFICFLIKWLLFHVCTLKKELKYQIILWKNFGYITCSKLKNNRTRDSYWLTNFPMWFSTKHRWLNRDFN